MLVVPLNFRRGILFVYKYKVAGILVWWIKHQIKIPATPTQSYDGR